MKTSKEVNDGEGTSGNSVCLGLQKHSLIEEDGHKPGIIFSLLVVLTSKMKESGLTLGVLVP